MKKESKPYNTSNDYQTHRRKPYTIEELHARINRSLESYRARDVYTQEEMKQIHPRV